MTERWTVLDVLKWTAERFTRASFGSPRLDAEVLIAHALGTTRVGLYTAFDKPLTDDERGRVRELVKRRLGGEPVAYLVGEKEFWSLPFEVTADVLVPRPDTETLVQTALELARELGARVVADVGTGSGAIAVVLAKELPETRVIAVDMSAPALVVARRNAERHAVADRVEFRDGDLLGPVTETVDLVVSNPPYVRAGEMLTLSPEVRSEPRTALEGGADGLDLMRRLVADAASRVLRPGGALVVEHGWDQGPDVRALFEAAGLTGVKTIADLAGHPRATLGRRA